MTVMTEDFKDSFDKGKVVKTRQSKFQDPKRDAETYLEQGVKQFTLRPGLQLSLIDVLSAESKRMDFELCDAPLEFSYHLSGDPLYSITHDKGEAVFHGEPGLNIVSAFPHSWGFMEIFPSTRNRMVAIHIDPLFFARYLKDQFQNPETPLPAAVERLINEDCFSFLCQQNRVTPSMMIVASQLLSCPYRGMLEKMFLESKTMELIVLQLERLACSLQNTDLTQREIQSVHKARSLLIQDILDPPGLFQLARAVSLSHTKLNRGFRHEFGVTVFEYLRQYRLERGKQLLDTLEMNVAEVAYSTGFSSPSHFAKAFRAHYSISPSSYLKEVQQRRFFSLPS